MSKKEFFSKIILLAQLFAIISFSSCYKDIDLNDYETEKDEVIAPSPRYYFFYHNSKIFHGHEYCNVVGDLRGKTTKYKEYINRRCKIYNDTILKR